MLVRNAPFNFEYFEKDDGEALFLLISSPQLIESVGGGQSVIYRGRARDLDSRIVPMSMVGARAQNIEANFGPRRPELCIVRCHYRLYFWD